MYAFQTSLSSSRHSFRALALDPELEVESGAVVPLQPPKAPG